MHRHLTLITILALVWLAGLAGQPLADTRQGGETIGSAVIIFSLPFQDGGTTSESIDDYNAQCPDSSTSPDVVYYYINNGEYETVTIDLCDSNYDTKVYVYDSSGEFVLACNDNFTCGVDRSLQSRIENLDLTQYGSVYIVVDGANGESGSYGFGMDADGACCLSSGECILTTRALCPGEFQGPYTSCGPDACPPTPVDASTWSTIKSLFQVE